MSAFRRPVERRRYLHACANSVRSGHLLSIAAGIGLWGMDIGTPRPSWAPDWSSIAVALLGLILVVRGVANFVATWGPLRRLPVVGPRLPDAAVDADAGPEQIVAEALRTAQEITE